MALTNPTLQAACGLPAEKMLASLKQEYSYMDGNLAVDTNLNNGISIFPVITADKTMGVSYGDGAEEPVLGFFLFFVR